MANSSRCSSRGAPIVPLPNLIRSAVSVVRLTVCDSLTLSGWRRRRRLDLDDSNKGDDVDRPPASGPLPSPSLERTWDVSFDGRTEGSAI